MEVDERPPKRQRLSAEPEDGAGSDSDHSELMDSLWANIELEEAKAPEPAAAVEDSSDDEDLGHLLDLDAIVADTATEAPSAALGSGFAALLPDVSTPSVEKPLPPDVDPPADSLADPGADDDVAKKALENLQAMLAGAAAEAQAEVEPEPEPEPELELPVEDEMLMSEDDVGGQEDEEMESDEEPLANLGKRSNRPTCAGCGLSFDDVETLSQHIHTHIKATSFICEGCSRVFSRADALKRHTLGATAVEQCQKASLEPDAFTETYINNEHSKLLNASTGIYTSAAYVPEPTMRPLRARKPGSQGAKTKKAPQKKAQAEKALKEETARERAKLKPAYAAFKAAHIANAIGKCVEDGLELKDVFRLAGVTGEQLVLLHWAFSEIVGLQEEYLQQYMDRKRATVTT